MITRRRFLGVLLGLAATPVLSQIPESSSLDGFPLVKSPIILPTINDCARLCGVHILGEGKSYRNGMVRILRGAIFINEGVVNKVENFPILAFSFNEYGGNVVWRPQAGLELFCSKEFPLVVDMTNSTASVSLMYAHADGSYHSQVIRNSKIEGNYVSYSA